MTAEAYPIHESSSRSQREEEGIIRPFRPADREAVREISRHTAFRNRGFDSVFEDGELFADYWTRYYTDFEPESCLVAEEGGRVIAYLLGCVDSGHFVAVMGRRILPPILLRIFVRLLTGRYRRPVTRRTLWWLLSRSWREAPPLNRKLFPAHYHCNVLSPGHRKRYYSRMVVIFLDRLAEMGIERLHGQVEEPVAGGAWLRMVQAYCQSCDCFHLLDYFAEKPSTFQRIVLGREKDFVNRVWGARVRVYRDWLLWAAQRYGL